MNADYTIVAEARGQRVLWFRRFGSYQGEWLLMSRDDDGRFYLYKDYYGSCSGCDTLEATFSWGDIAEDHPALPDFLKQYPSFLEMTAEGALTLAERDNNLLHVLPRNRREWQGFEGATHEEVGYQLALIVKNELGKITAREILDIDNQEIRREAIEAYGAESFVENLPGVRLIHAEGADQLYHFEAAGIGPEPFAFLYLKDGSTERRYILRTAPAHQTVREARAASFGIPADRFDLVQET